MTPISPILTISFLILHGVFGFAIGAGSGFLASLLARTRPRRVILDAVIGSAAYFAGFIGTILVPWQNTITYQLKGGGTVESTMPFYQHPERIAILFAVLVPVLYELNRLRRNRRVSTQVVRDEQA